MVSASMLASLRAWLLADSALAAIVGERVHVSRSDVAGNVPAVAVEMAGGAGQMNEVMDRADVTVNAWSLVSWAEALSALDAAAKRLRNATHVTGLAAPVLRVSSVGAPRQVSDASYYHAQFTITCIVKEA